MATEQRLIDANELEVKMGGLCDEFGTDHLFIDAIVYEIGNAPTVDAVEVVRCRDCIYRHTRYNCHGRQMDFFCADGKRVGGRVNG